MKGIFVLLSCLLVCGCMTTRDRTFDHCLPRFVPPEIDLSRYKPVQDRKGQDPDLALAVAVSGGGHRAANFAMGVMLGLEEFKCGEKEYNLLNEIDYFSTVSGGGFAAGMYLSTLHDHSQKFSSPKGYSLAKVLNADNYRYLTNLERDYQSTVFEGMYHFLCIFTHRDVGDILERKFDRYLLGSRYRKKRESLRLGSMYKERGDSAPVQLPYWAANATVYENGVRFPFTPDIIEKYGIAGYTHGMKKEKLADGYDMPLAVGMKASASFPVAIPASTFKCATPDDPLNKYLHLVDGGLVDNLGLLTAFDLLKQDKAKNKVLLIINAYKGVSYPHSATEQSPAGAPVAIRIMKISLDTKQSLLRGKVDQLVSLAEETSGCKISVIFLSFDELKPEVEKRVRNVKEEIASLKKERTAAVMRRMKRNINAALRREAMELEEAEAEYALYHDARAVGTSLNITRGSQKLLLKAGKKVVENNRDLLRRNIVEEIER